MVPRLRLLGPALIALGLVAGCSGSTLTTEPQEPVPSTRAAETPHPSPTQMPRVIVIHPSRGPVDVSVRQAERLIAGDVSRWQEMASTTGRIRYVHDNSADRVVRRVAGDPRAIGVVPADAVDPSVRVVSVDGVDPLQAPGRYPLLSDGARPARVVTVTVVGDIMLARRVADAMDGDYAAPLRPTARSLAEADLTIGNLESTLSRQGTPTQGSDSFGADPRVRRGLALAGFDVLSLANNHIGDYGELALRQTLLRIEQGGFRAVGAGLTRREALEPVVVDVRGTRVGIVAFNSIGESPAASSGSPGTAQLRMPPRTGPLNRGDLAAIVSHVRDLCARVDVVLVLPHWGDQYTSRPLPVQRRVAERLARAGADVVVGGHPHWVQGFEMVDQSLLAYSLGNFVFDMDFSRPTMEGIVLDLTFWDGELKAAVPRPVVLDEDFAPRFRHGARAEQVLSDVWSNSYGTFNAQR